MAQWCRGSRERGNIMRVGVITFHNAHNYGASLQAYALQRALKELGTEPALIHYHPKVIDILYQPVPEKGMKGTLKKIRMSLRKRPRARLVKYKKYRRFIEKNFTLLGDYTTYEELKSGGLLLDAYITGSDQVWNPVHTGGFDPAFTLDFVKSGAKKISYAASVGRALVPDQYREDFRSSLKTFTAISVREESIRNDIEVLSGQPVTVVLDPTLLLERKAYDAIKVPARWKERYILVYMMEKNKKMVAFANKISKFTGFPIVQRKLPGIFQNEYDSFYTHDPGEFLGDIEGAEFVLTNSFHGTVFSIIYEKPFLAMLHTNTGARTADLLKLLELESHIVYEPEEFRDLNQMKIKDILKLRERIHVLRDESMEFLRRNLV